MVAFATGADSLDLDKLFGPSQQVATAFKRLALKVGAEAVGEDGDIQFITDQGELEYLRLSTELSLIDQDAVEVFVLVNFENLGEEVGVSVKDLGFSF